MTHRARMLLGAIVWLLIMAACVANAEEYVIDFEDMLPNETGWEYELRQRCVISFHDLPETKAEAAAWDRRDYCQYQEEKPMAKESVGTNIKYDVTKAGKLVIEIDLTKEFGESKSGKTIRIASTEGNKRMYDHKNNAFMIGLNAYKYPEKEE